LEYFTKRTQHSREDARWSGGAQLWRRRIWLEGFAHDGALYHAGDHWREFRIRGIYLRRYEMRMGVPTNP
jgi:hypothetical protein